VACLLPGRPPPDGLITIDGHATIDSTPSYRLKKRLIITICMHLLSVLPLCLMQYNMFMHNIENLFRSFERPCERGRGQDTGTKDATEEKLVAQAHETDRVRK